MGKLWNTSWNPYFCNFFLFFLFMARSHNLCYEENIIASYNLILDIEIVSVIKKTLKFHIQKT